MTRIRTALVALVVTASAAQTQMHGGPQFSIGNGRLGPYSASVWTDGALGMGTFNVMLDMPDGAAFAKPSAVRLGLSPMTGGAETIYEAGFSPTRNGARYHAMVSLPNPERYRVRVIVASAGVDAEFVTAVDARVPGMFGPLSPLLYSLPFVLTALLWWRVGHVRRRTQALVNRGRSPSHCRVQPAGDSLSHREFLGEFEQTVLLAILQLGEHAYAPDVAKHLEKSIDRSVSRGALYSCLNQLERKGLLRWRREEPTPDRGGHARRFYNVTARGVRSLRASREGVMILWQGLEGILGRAK